MTTASKTAETETAKIEIKLTRTVNDKTAYSDGYNIGTGREVYENYDVTITNKQTGKTMRTYGKPGGFAFFSKPSGKNLPAGAVARIGDTYIGQNTYAACMILIAALDAELPKSDEQIALEQAEAERKARIEENEKHNEAERRERESHPGWCNRCQSYCYGDCRSN